MASPATELDTRHAPHGHGWRAARAITWTVLGLAAAAYAAVLAHRLADFLTRQLPSSDTISPVLLVRAIASGDHGTIYLGNHPGYSDLLVSALGLRFPDPTLSPQAATYAIYVVGALILTWTVRRSGGWGAAVVALLISLLASPWLLFNEASPAGRVTSLANLAVLGWVLVALSSSRRRSPATLAAMVLGAGVMSGIDVVSDPLLAAVGMVPFLLTGIVLWLRTRDRAGAVLAGAVTATTAIAVASALATLAVARRLSLEAPANHIHLATARDALHNLHLVGAATGAAFGQIFSAAQAGSMSYVQSAVGLVVLAAVVAALVGAGRRLLRPPAADPGGRAESAHRLYWALVAGCDLAAVLASTYAVNITAIRYLTPMWLALAALIPLAARRRRVALLALPVLVAALAAGDAVSLATLQIPAPVATSPLVAGLESAQVSHAYADYWDANLITWSTRGTIPVRQVRECGSDGHHLCPYRINAAAAWFRASPGPVGVVVDPRYSLRDPPSAAYGKPERILRVPGGISIYVYAQLSLGSGP